MCRSRGMGACTALILNWHAFACPSHGCEYGKLPCRLPRCCTNFPLHNTVLGTFRSLEIDVSCIDWGGPGHVYRCHSDTVLKPGGHKHSDIILTVNTCPLNLARAPFPKLQRP